MIDEDAESLPTPLGQTRQVTIDALCEHFANDVMGVEEFERRIDVAHKAASVDELRELLRDLPGGGLPVPAGVNAPASGRGYSVVSPDSIRESAYAVAILGGTRRAGRWTPARVNHAFAVCGGAELDFREAALGPGVTELRVFAMWGGVDIIVPPGLNVESHGMGIMGGFDHMLDDRPEHDPLAPTLRISGVALMGGVDITVRQVGESARDARQRRRQERRERLRGVRDGAREIAEEAKRQIRRPGSGI